MSTDIKVPTLGESVSEATVAKWLKQVGDSVSADEALVELETDKVTVEVNAPSAGIISEIAVNAGGTVAVGALLGRIGGSAVAGNKPTASAAPPISAAVVTPPAAVSVTPPAAVAPSAAAAQSGPAARKLLEETGINPATLSGTGKDGRVTKGDVLAAASAPVAPVAKAPVVAGSRPRADREERVRMSRLRQRIAERLKDAQNTAAMLTTFNEVDMSALMALRNQYKDGFEKKHGVKLGFMSFFVKAAISALKEIPAVNAEIEGDELVYKNYYDIGMAVGTEQGLVVPVVRDADLLSLAGIEKTIGGLAKKARDGKLSLPDLSGGTFTITNGGVYGSLMSTPILNPPQSGILGLHKIQERPIAVAGKIEIRPMMYLALSYDHRIIDGKEAVTFLVRIKECVEDPQRLLIDV